MFLFTYLNVETEKVFEYFDKDFGGNERKGRANMRREGKGKELRDPLFV